MTHPIVEKRADELKEAHPTWGMLRCLHVAQDEFEAGKLEPIQFRLPIAVEQKIKITCPHCGGQVTLGVGG